MKLIDENNCTYLNDKPKRKLVIYCTVFALLLLYFVPTFIYVANNSLSDIGKENSNNRTMAFEAPRDAYLRYVEGYYFLEGTDPFDLILNKKEYDKYRLTGGLMPTGYLLHYFLMPSYLPPKLAIWIYMIFLAIAVGISCFLIYKFVNLKAGLSAAILCVFLYIAQKYTFTCFLIIGNYAIFSFAVIIAMCFTDFFEKHPILGGIIMGIAMIKAQMMVLLFLPFLMQKRYLSIFSSVATFLVMLVITANQFDKTPLDTLAGYLEFSSSNRLYMKSRAYMGVFKDVAQFFYANNLEIAKLASKIGTLFFFLLSCGISYKYRNANKIFLYTFLALISTVWGYNFSTTTLSIVYILMAIPIVISLLKSEKITYAKIAIYGLFFLIMVPFNPLNNFGFSERIDFPYAFLLERLHLFLTFAYIIYDCKKNNLWGYLTVGDVEKPANSLQNSKGEKSIKI